MGLSLKIEEINENIVNEVFYKKVGIDKIKNSVKQANKNFEVDKKEQNVEIER